MSASLGRPVPSSSACISWPTIAGSLSCSTNLTIRARWAGEQRRRAFREHAGLPQHAGARPELSRVQHAGEERLEDPENLLPDVALGLGLEQVVEGGQGGFAQVAGVLQRHFPREILDLGVVEEVQRGVELVDVDHALGPRRRVDRGAALPGRGGVLALLDGFALGPGQAGRLRGLLRGAAGQVHADFRGVAGARRVLGVGRDLGGAVVLQEFGEAAVDVLEVLRPEQREEVVGGVGGQPADLC